MRRLTQTIRLSSTPNPSCSARGAAEILDHATGRRCGANGLLLDAGFHLRRDVVARDEHECNDRHEDRRHEGQKELSVEARADLAQQSRAPQFAAANPFENGAAAQDEDVDENGQHCHFGEVDQVVERGNYRKAQRVDPAAVVEEIHVVPLLTASQLHPGAVSGLLDSSKDLIRERPCRRGIGIERRSAPPIDGEFDVSSGQAFPLHAVGRQQDLDVRIARGNERQVAVVVGERVHDDGAERRRAGIGRAECAAGVQDAALLGKKRRDFLVEIPVARPLL